MKITDLLKSQDSKLIQKLFMSIPVKDYLNYVYSSPASRKTADITIKEMLSYSDCNSTYIVDFDEPHMGPDENITIGQLLKIAYNMFPVNAENLYPKPDRKKAEQAAMSIVLKLIIMPFFSMFSREFSDYCRVYYVDPPADDEEDEEDTYEAVDFDDLCNFEIDFPF